MGGTPEGPAVSADRNRRQEAKEMADEFLGRTAGIARASIKPLGIFGRLALVAGVVIWAVGPAPWWASPPHIVFSLIALAVLLFPGVRLLRHRSRMQQVLKELPTLLDSAIQSLGDTTGRVGSMGAHWRQSGAEGKAGVLTTGRRCWKFYREDIAPLREENKVVGQVTDVIGAFSAPALFLSGIAFALGLVLIVLCPLAVFIRLILLVS